jgi:hypothetical protein
MWVSAAPEVDGHPLMEGDRVLIMSADPTIAEAWSYEWPDGPDRGLLRLPELASGTIAPAGYVVAAGGTRYVTGDDWLVGTSAPTWRVVP